MNEQIIEIREKILNALKNNDVIRASLFGSVVRGELTDESDVDILVEFRRGKSLLDLVGLKVVEGCLD